MRVIGVDPGTAVTGYGIAELCADGLAYVDAGVIRAAPRAAHSTKLLNIHDRLSRLILQYAPDAMSLERSFVAYNIQSAFRLGEVRAMALLAAARHGLALHEYAPTRVKLLVAAHGQAGKAQVKFMVRRTLGLDEEQTLADDAADALALALCHLRLARFDEAAAAAPGQRP